MTFSGAYFLWTAIKLKEAATSVLYNYIITLPNANALNHRRPFITGEGEIEKNGSTVIFGKGML